MMFKGNVIPLLVGITALITVGCSGFGDSMQPAITDEPLSCLAPTCEDVPVRTGDVTVGFSANSKLRYVNRASLPAE